MLRIYRTTISHLFLVTFILSPVFANAYRNRAEVWADELTGESENIISDQNRESYKQNLLQYVFRTHQPTDEQLNVDNRNVPYVMDKLYELLASKDTGQEKDSTPFNVDYIRGLQDHWGKQLICIMYS